MKIDNNKESELINLIERLVEDCLNRPETIIMEEKDKNGFLIACKQILDIIHDFYGK